MDAQQSRQTTIESYYFRAAFGGTTIEVRREVTESDGAGGDDALGWQTAGELPGRIVRGSRDPQAPVQGQTVTTVTSWEVRLSLSAYRNLQEQEQRKGGSFAVRVGMRLRDQATGTEYEVLGTDEGRSAATFLAVTCRRIGS